MTHDHENMSGKRGTLKVGVGGVLTDFKAIVIAPNFPRIVCLCGSTKFKEQLIEENARFTGEGEIVLSVGWYSHADQRELTEEFKTQLDVLHKHKIDLADHVYVINVNGYVGDSTLSEIDHARATGKPITFREPVRRQLTCPSCGNRDEDDTVEPFESAAGCSRECGFKGPMEPTGFGL
jgi:hypothetical protein